MRSIHPPFRAALLIGAALALLSGPLGAQEAKPGPEHEVLKEHAGVWDAVIASQGSEFKGVQSAKMALGGLWLLEEFKGEFGGQAFEGRGSTTYDAARKKYVSVWIDSMSTSPMLCEGDYDKATKTLKLTGTMNLPDGGSMKVTQTLVTKDADTRLFKLEAVGPDGQGFEMMSITYKRRKG